MCACSCTPVEKPEEDDETEEDESQEPVTESKEDKAKKDKVTLLKDKSGNQMFLKNAV